MTDGWDDDYTDEDYTSGDWADDDDAAVVVPCPHCGADIYEEAEQCPRCGDFIVHDTRVWSDKPMWWLLLGLAGILAVIAIWSGLAVLW